MTVLLVAHGSADPRAAAATRALARAVASARGAGSACGAAAGPVWVSFLDHTQPRPDAALFELSAAGCRSVTVVPLLLTAAYHNRVDIPLALDRAAAHGLDLRVELSDVLGPVGGLVPGPLVGGLRRRLAEAGRDADAGCGFDAEAGRGFDAVVLAAAGTRDADALSTVEQSAQALGASLRLPCRVAYASASGPTTGEAVAALRAEGARRVAMAAYFLAPGRLYDSAVASARAAGAVAVAAPLGDAPELVRLVLHRAAAARVRVAPVPVPA